MINLQFHCMISDFLRAVYRVDVQSKEKGSPSQGRDNQVRYVVNISSVVHPFVGCWNSTSACCPNHQCDRSRFPFVSTRNVNLSPLTEMHPNPGDDFFRFRPSCVWSHTFPCRRVSDEEQDRDPRRFIEIENSFARKDRPCRFRRSEKSADIVLVDICSAFCMRHPV
jgi:hypothetical protein